jgi:hypothetical protein
MSLPLAILIVLGAAALAFCAVVLVRLGGRAGCF